MKVGLNGDIEDAAVIPVPNSELVLVKNIDIFTPIVDEPNIMGQIAACNVTNDLFAMNVLEVSGMLAFLAIQTSTPIEIAEGILEGMKYFMEEKIKSKIVGGHTIYCEWPLMGGEASGFLYKDAVIPKGGVREGDELILTKPVGLQAITAAYRIRKDMPELLSAYSSQEIQNSIDFAIDLMTTSNQDVVKIIHTYNDMSFIHAMSDVTGFGLAGHVQEMLQNSYLSAEIKIVPYIKLSNELSKEFGYAFDECSTHETAGGMVMSVDPLKVDEFSKRLKENGVNNWIIGTIDSAGSNEVKISENVDFVEVSK